MATVDSPTSQASPFGTVADLPLRSLDDLPLAPVLVVAPHPDDETLGCGGAIALLRSRGYPVQVLVVSDGTRSHPRSQLYPAPRLRQVREAESLAALALLGVEAAAVTFLGLPDGAVPAVDLAHLHEASALAALEHCRAYLGRVRPQTIFLPYRFDPHRDHRASWGLVQAALGALPSPPRLIEYPIWDWDPKQRQPLGDLYSAWRLDIAAQVDLKRRAIDYYRSQTTNLIADDPTGFRLSPELMANFLHPWEIYLEQTP